MSGSIRLLPGWRSQHYHSPPPSLLKFLTAHSPVSSDDGCRAVVGDCGAQLDCGKGVGTSGMGKETGSCQKVCKCHSGISVTKQRLLSLVAITSKEESMVKLIPDYVFPHP